LRQKGYYVDGHEKPATIEYRKAFCERYLMYESRMHQWVQVREELAKKTRRKREILQSAVVIIILMQSQRRKW
jgi:hypothetical protein